MLKIYLILVAIFFGGCFDNKPAKHYDGSKLLTQKCSSCHNLDMPPKLSDTEKAPPIMAVAFHVYSFVKPSNESERGLQSKEFVVDYVLSPSASKSFCDKDSLKRYGVMPSQKGKVTKDELKAIAEYMFEHFTPQNLAKIQAQKAKFDALPEGEKIAIKNKCLQCHKVSVKTVGPSLKSLAKMLPKEKDRFIKSIKNGSKGRWKDSHGAIMPSFSKIPQDKLYTLIDWISKKYNK